MVKLLFLFLDQVFLCTSKRDLCRHFHTLDHFIDEEGVSRCGISCPVVLLHSTKPELLQLTDAGVEIRIYLMCLLAPFLRIVECGTAEFVVQVQRVAKTLLYLHDHGVLGYEQTVRTAFQEVANALITRAKLEDIYVQQFRCVQCYVDAVNVSRDRYIAGKASYYEVLEAQQELFPAENNLAQTELYRRTVVIQLYKALGGGWNLPDDKWGTAP